jgi:hypothetical protein
MRQAETVPASTRRPVGITDSFWCKFHVTGWDLCRIAFRWHLIYWVTLADFNLLWRLLSDSWIHRSVVWITHGMWVLCVLVIFTSVPGSDVGFFRAPGVWMTFIHSSVALQPFVGPWPLLQFHNLFYTDGRTPWTSDQPLARPLPKHRTTQTQNKRTQTSMSWVGFEPTIPVFKRAKTVHALDRFGDCDRHE